MPNKKVTKKQQLKKSPPPKKKKVNKPEPKVDAKVKFISTKQGLVEVKVKNEAQSKKDNRKYVKVYENDPPEKRKEIGERIFKKEIKFAYYASEGSQGVWYYVVLH
jgi:hypothetical protein